MTAPAPRPAPTPLQKQTRLLRENLAALVNCLLNGIFALTRNAGRRRKNSLIFLMILAGMLFSFISHPWAEWRQMLQSLFMSLFGGDFIGWLIEFINFAVRVLFAPQTLHFLPVLLIPFLIGLQLAGKYLADIFELENIDVATKFIRQAALGSHYDTIHIRGGEIAPDDRDSPIVQIGGPGHVVVELDSAALFEKPDGQPHVIGPTISQMWKRETLEGFERFRQAVDLRDHVNDITAGNRSLDGISVEAMDVRFLFSVRRTLNGDQAAPTLERPYPFVEQAIRDIVYGDPRWVAAAPVPRWGSQQGWLISMTVFIRGELARFIGERNLSEFLSSIGQPEVYAADAQEQQIRDENLNLVPQNGQPAAPPPLTPANFAPRSEVASLFGEFAEGFTSKTRRRGIALRWIGVGTWKTPDELIPANSLIPERHLEAWRISRENAVRGNERALNLLREDAAHDETLRLVQEVLASFRRYNDNPAIGERQLLQTYLGQLQDARTRAETAGFHEHANDMDRAIQILRRWLGFRFGPEDEPDDAEVAG